MEIVPHRASMEMAFNTEKLWQRKKKNTNTYIVKSQNITKDRKSQLPSVTSGIELWLYYPEPLPAHKKIFLALRQTLLSCNH